MSVVLKVNTHSTVVGNLTVATNKVTGFLIDIDTMLNIVGNSHVLKSDVRCTMCNRDTTIKPLECDVTNHDIVSGYSEADAVSIAVTINGTSLAVEHHIRCSKPKFGFQNILSQSHIFSDIDGLINVAKI